MGGRRKPKGFSGCTTTAGDDSDGLEVVSRLTPEQALKAEWSACSSTRRYLVTLNEAEVPLMPLVERLVEIASTFAPPRRRKSWQREINLAIRLADVEYEMVLFFAFLLGEEVVCKAIRARWPLPPEGVWDMRGTLVGHRRELSISPRHEPHKIRESLFGVTPD